VSVFDLNINVAAVLVGGVGRSEEEGLDDLRERGREGGREGGRERRRGESKGGGHRRR
jgi:hypothetical protein